MAKVWESAIDGAESVMKVFVKKQEESAVLQDMRTVLARLSLHLLNAVCFGQDEDFLFELEGHEPKPKGHNLGFGQAMDKILDVMPVIFFTPPVISSPSSSSK